MRERYTEVESNRDLAGQIYKHLLTWLESRFNQFLLVRRPEEPLDSSGQDVLSLLEPWLLSRELDKEWPGTLLHEDLAEVSRFRLTPAALEILLTATDCLSNWQQPDMPEDLCILRDTGEAVLVSIAHENIWAMALTDAEWQELAREIPQISTFLPFDNEN